MGTDLKGIRVDGRAFPGSRARMSTAHLRPFKGGGQASPWGSRTQRLVHPRVFGVDPRPSRRSRAGVSKVKPRAFGTDEWAYCGLALWIPLDECPIHAKPLYVSRKCDSKLCPIGLIALRPLSTCQTTPFIHSPALSLSQTSTRQALAEHYPRTPLAR